MEPAQQANRGTVGTYPVYPKWRYFRHKLFRYREVEQRVARQPGVSSFLDIGCGDGENLLLFNHGSLRVAGLEVSLDRLRIARTNGLDVMLGRGEALPFLNLSWDMVYVAHVLHHVRAYKQVLAEIQRCLAPGGYVFVVETVEDNPLLRLSRRLRPSWRGDSLEVRWRFEDLKAELLQNGFEIQEFGRYNIVFFLWEMAPIKFWPLEFITPLFVYLDILLAKILGDELAAHCYFVLRLKDEADPRSKKAQ